PLLEALGQVLAEDVRAPFDLPPMDNSAMDGYALLGADIRGASPASPISLKIVGQAFAGHPGDQAVGPGTAVRIMTGAPIPPGADTVVPFEETDELEQRARGIRGLDIQQIGIKVEMPLGANVRPAAEDVRRGDLILSAGSVLGPAHLGVLASLGYGTVSVFRRPVVAI